MFIENDNQWIRWLILIGQRTTHFYQILSTNHQSWTQRDFNDGYRSFEWLCNENCPDLVPFAPIDSCDFVAIKHIQWNSILIHHRSILIVDFSFLFYELPSCFKNQELNRSFISDVSSNLLRSPLKLKFVTSKWNELNKSIGYFSSEWWTEKYDNIIHSFPSVELGW